MVKGDGTVLPELQAFHRESRFHAEDAATPVLAEPPAETTVKVVEQTHPVTLGAAAVAETTMQTTVSSNQRMMAVHKMVPWTEHDAVSPERLQFWTKGTRLMRCIGIIDRSHDFRSFQFVSEEPTLFFCFDTTTDKYLFLAAGSGVTPMLSMARWWHDIGAQPDVIFYHSVREPEDAVFTEDMMTFTSANRGFKYVTAFTSRDLPENWPGLRGRFSEDQLVKIAPDFQERMVFTCGPDPFMRMVKLILEKNGFNIKERFRQESFGALKDKTSTEPTPVTVFEKPATVSLVYRPAPTLTSSAATGRYSCAPAAALSTMVILAWC